MALIVTGNGITDIRGGFGGVYFTRDKSGLHCSSKPRRVHQRTTAQDKQRDCFTKARTYTKDPRWVSYYIYRCLNNLPFIFDAIVTGDPVPNCTGKYELAGTLYEKDYYRRKDGDYYIWWNSIDRWIIGLTLEQVSPGHWFRISPNIVGEYAKSGSFTGTATVTLSLTPPPADYQIPKL